MRHFAKAGVFGAIVGGAMAFGDTTILVINEGMFGPGTNTASGLASLGHTVTLTPGTVPSDLSGYDQVWDLRTTTTIGNSQFLSYLQGGGRMFVTGVDDVFRDPRNYSVKSFISFVGAGLINMGSGPLYPFPSGEQFLTAEGQALNTPNAYTTLFLSSGLYVVTDPAEGFLVTETAPNSRRGSLIGFDFGDIGHAPNARMLVGFDESFYTTFSAPLGWLENMTTYLGAPENPIIPLPSGVAMAVVGLGLIGVRRRRG